MGFRNPRRNEAGSFCEIGRLIIDLYSTDYLRSVFDTKNGAGSAEYVAEAFRCYREQNPEVS